jgi:hypothetical protein
VAQLYSRALGSLYVISYDSQGYIVGILTIPKSSGPGPVIYILQEQNIQSQKSKSKVSLVTADGQSIIVSWCLVHSALKGFHPCEYHSNMRIGTLGRIFFTIARAACEACCARWNLCSNSAFAEGQRKNLIEFAAWRTFRMLTSSKQSGIKYVTLNTSPYMCCFFLSFFLSFFRTFFFLFFLRKNLQVAFTKITSVYNLDKHQSVYNTCGRRIYV